jgi:hypothetical protein
VSSRSAQRGIRAPRVIPSAARDPRLLLFSGLGHRQAPCMTAVAFLLRHPPSAALPALARPANHPQPPRPGSPHSKKRTLLPTKAQRISSLTSARSTSNHPNSKRQTLPSSSFSRTLLSPRAPKAHSPGRQVPRRRPGAPHLPAFGRCGIRPTRPIATPHPLLC